MSRRAHVLAALTGAGGSAVSGEAIAGAVGVSRVAVAKHIAHLRDQGFAIESVRGVGYRLVSRPDALTADEVASRVTSQLVREVVGAEVTESTNDDAKRLARAGAPEISVAIASAQTAGRGRLGREWSSPTGGVYASFVFRPEVPVASLTCLPLVVGLGVGETLEALGAHVGLKWPNDILLLGPGTAPHSVGAPAPRIRAGDSGKLPHVLGKVAGVLLEVAAESDRVEWVVAGIGLNVRRPAGAATGAVYLDDVCPGLELAAIAAALVDGVSDVYARFRSDGFAALKAAYEARHVLAGGEVTVSAIDGAEVASGRVSGLDVDGRLLVDTGVRTIAVATGDVTLRRALIDRRRSLGLP